MSADILRILVVLLGIAVVAVVLIQQPKEGGMGAFTGGGGGASSTVFGAKGSGSFLFKLTAGLALTFAVLVIALVKVTNSDLGGSVLSQPVATADAIPGQENTSTQSEGDASTVVTPDAIPGSIPEIQPAIPGEVPNE